MFFQAELRIPVNVTAAAVNSTFRNVFPDVLAETLSFLQAEEKFFLLSGFSLSFSLNAEFRCLFRPMISAFPEKNALPQPTTPVKFSSISNSPQTNFSRPDLRKPITSESVPADAADAQKEKPCSNFEHGFLFTRKTE